MPAPAPATTTSISDATPAPTTSISAPTPAGPSPAGGDPTAAGSTEGAATPAAAGDGGKRSGSSFCFPPSASARLAGGAVRPLAALAPGDELLGAHGESTRFVADFHEGLAGRRTALTKYLSIEHEHQQTGRPLLITANHFVFVAGATEQVLPAGELQPGVHSLLVHTPGRGDVASAVKSIGEVWLPGFSAPLTEAGALVVEGVVVSSYALLSETQLDLFRYGPAVVRQNAQELCHAAALPFRMFGASSRWGAGYLQSLSGIFDALQASLAMFKLSTASL